MNKKTKKKVQKIFLTALVVLFGIQQSAISVWAAPGDIVDGTLTATYNAQDLSGQAVPSGSNIDVTVELDVEEEGDQSPVLEPSWNLPPVLTDSNGQVQDSTFTPVANMPGMFSLALNPDLASGNYVLVLGNSPDQPFAQGQISFSIVNNQPGNEPAVSIVNAEFDINDFTAPASSFVPFNVLAYYSDNPEVGVAPKNTEDILFTITEKDTSTMVSQELVADPADLSKFSIRVDQNQVQHIIYEVNLYTKSNPGEKVDTFTLRIVPEIMFGHVDFSQSSYVVGDILDITTQYYLQNNPANPYPLTIDTVQVSLHKWNSETETFVDLHTTLTTSDLLGNYVTTLDAETFSTGTYAIKLLDADKNTVISDSDLTTYFEFIITEPLPEIPEKSFMAVTQDIDANGHLDQIIVTFPDVVDTTNTVVPMMQVDGFTVTGEEWMENGSLRMYVNKADNLLDTLCDNDIAGNACETGLRPTTTLMGNFQQIGTKSTVPADGAKPIISKYTTGSSVNGEQFYNQSVLHFSEDVFTHQIPSAIFTQTCGSLESCVFVSYLGVMSTNTYSLIIPENVNNKVHFMFGDSSKYPFNEIDVAGPFILITADGLTTDYAGNPLLATAAHPINNITLTSQANLNSIEQNSSFDVTTYVEYFGMPNSAMNLPQGYELVINPAIEGSSITSKGNGIYTISVPTSTATGTYELGLNIEDTGNTLSFTVIEQTEDVEEPVEQPTTNPGSGSGGGSGGGGATIPTNHAPKAVIKEILSSIVSGISMTVDGSQSTDPDNNPIFFSWNFGDGSTVTELSTLDAVLTHTYTNPGTYTITLKVQDSNQASNTTSTVIMVLQGEPVTETPVNTSTPPATEQPTVNNDQQTTPVVSTETPTQSVTTETVVDTTDEETEQVITTVDETEVQPVVEQSAEEELPDWLAWLFGSSTAVAAVWTGILANRYRKYVA